MQNQWYIARDGKQYGPISDGDLVQLVQNRELYDGDYLWRHGFDNWLPAAQISELRDLVQNGGQAESHAPVQNAAPATFEETAVNHTIVNPLADEAVRGLAPVGQHDAAFTPTDMMNTQVNEVADPLMDHTQAEAAQPNVQKQKEDYEEILDTAQKNSVTGKVVQEAYGLDPNYRQSQKPRDEAIQPRKPIGEFSAQPVAVGGKVREKAPANRKKEGGLGWPAIVGICAGVLLLLVVGGVVLLPFVVPPDTIKAQISSVLKEKTGRDVSLKGKLSYRFFPSFGVDLNQIIIHNPPNIKGPDFLNLGRLQADLKLLPLLQKRVEVDRIILHRPEFALITDDRGKTNYEFKTAFAPVHRRLARAFRVAQSGTIDTGDIIAKTLEALEKEEAEKEKLKKAGDPKGPDVPDTKRGEVKVAGDVLVDEIKIINGAVKLINQKTNGDTTINAINLTLNAPDRAKPILAKGALRYREQRISLNAEVNSLGHVLDGKEAATTVAMTSDQFEGQFNGNIDLKEGVRFSGITDVQTYSLQKLLAWLGTDVPQKGYGASYVRGKISGDRGLITLKDAKIKIDQTMLQGSLRMRAQAPRPRVEALLATKSLDLTPYLEQKNEIRRGSLEGGRKTSVAAWNSSKIDFTALRLIDGIAQLKADKLIASGHTLEKSNIVVKLNAGLMNLALPTFQLYGGSGSLKMAVNAASARPTVKGVMDLRKVQVKPFLVNSSGFDWVSGVGDVKMEFVGAGDTQLALISTLNGNGKVSIVDGAIEGINIPAALRNLKSGKLPSSTKSKTEKTDFSSLIASFTIDKGIVYNKDLDVKGPLVRVNGEGAINLPREQIDYGLRPKLVGSLAGQGGRGDIAGLNIPVRLVGPLKNPKIVPDTKALLANDGKVVQDTVKTVETVVKKLKKKKISSDEMKDLLNGMVDGDGDAANIIDNILQ